MSRRSDRKWAEKDAREDAKGSKHGPKPDKVVHRDPNETKEEGRYQRSASRAYKASFHASKAKLAGGTDDSRAELHRQAMEAHEKAADHARASGVVAQPGEHPAEPHYRELRMRDRIEYHEKAAQKHREEMSKAAGEYHDQSFAAYAATRAADKASEQAGTMKEHAAAGELHLHAAALHGAMGNKVQAARHVQEAEHHASAAGSDWDESKHPRDENGKFT